MPNHFYFMIKKKPEETQVEEAPKVIAPTAEEIARAKAKIEVDKLRGEVSQRIPIVHAKIATLEKEVINLKTVAGNLEGAVITAGDVARHDPVRALEGLKRAIAAAG